MAHIDICKSKSGKTHHGRIFATPDEAGEIHSKLRLIAQRQHDLKSGRSPAIETSCTFDKTAGEYLLTFNNFTSSDDVQRLVAGGDD